MAGGSPEARRAWADISSDSDPDLYASRWGPRAAAASAPVVHRDGISNLGARVGGRVVRADDEGVHVDIGAASLAFLPNVDGAGNLRVDDVVDNLYVRSLDDSHKGGDSGLRLGMRSEAPVLHACLSSLPSTASQPSRRGLVLLTRTQSKATCSTSGGRIQPSHVQLSAEPPSAEEVEENFWRRPKPNSKSGPSTAKRRCGVSNEFKRAIRALLNNLDQKPLQAISDQLARIPITKAAELAFISGSVVRLALEAPQQIPVYADLAQSLNGLLPEVSSDDRQLSFLSLLADVCHTELWARPSAPPGVDSQELKRWAETKQDRMIAHMHFVGHLIVRCLLPAKVAGIVAEELLLGFTGTDALPGESDVLCACELLLIAGGTLHAAAGAELLCNVCEKLAKLEKAKRTNASVVNPTVSVYSKQAQLCIARVLRLDGEQWQQETDRSRTSSGGELVLPHASEPDAPIPHVVAGPVESSSSGTPTKAASKVDISDDEDLGFDLMACVVKQGPASKTALGQKVLAAATDSRLCSLEAPKVAAAGPAKPPAYSSLLAKMQKAKPKGASRKPDTTRWSAITEQKETPAEQTSQKSAPHDQDMDSKKNLPDPGKPDDRAASVTDSHKLEATRTSQSTRRVAKSPRLEVQNMPAQGVGKSSETSSEADAIDWEQIRAEAEQAVAEEEAEEASREKLLLQSAVTSSAKRLEKTSKSKKNVGKGKDDAVTPSAGRPHGMQQAHVKSNAPARRAGACVAEAVEPTALLHLGDAQTARALRQPDCKDIHASTKPTVSSKEVSNVACTTAGHKTTSAVKTPPKAKTSSTHTTPTTSVKNTEVVATLVTIPPSGLTAAALAKFQDKTQDAGNPRRAAEADCSAGDAKGAFCDDPDAKKDFFLPGEGVRPTRDPDDDANSVFSSGFWGDSDNEDVAAKDVVPAKHSSDPDLKMLEESVHVKIASDETLQPSFTAGAKRWQRHKLHERAGGAIH